jgi:membrane protease YdiL (CAAX protease family)
MHPLLPWFLLAQLIPGLLLAGHMGWTVVGTIAMVVVAALLITRNRSTTCAWLGLCVPAAGWSAATWALLLPTVVWPRWLALPFYTLLVETTAPIYTGTGWGYAAVAVLVVPLAEELLYRGVLITATQSYGRWPAITVSALLFGLGHGPALAISTFVVGWVLAWLAWEYRSIWPGFLLHAAFNLFAAIGAWTLPDELSGPSGAPALLVMLIILGAAVRATRRGWPLIRQIATGPWRERVPGQTYGQPIWQIIGLWPVTIVALMSVINLVVGLAAR